MAKVKLTTNTYDYSHTYETLKLVHQEIQYVECSVIEAIILIHETNSIECEGDGHKVYTCKDRRLTTSIAELVEDVV